MKTNNTQSKNNTKSNSKNSLNKPPFKSTKSLHKITNNPIMKLTGKFSIIKKTPQITKKTIKQPTNKTRNQKNEIQKNDKIAGSSFSKRIRKMPSKQLKDNNLTTKSFSDSNNISNNQKKEQQSYDAELLKVQFKKIKEFLTPILKEENAKQLISLYNKKENKKKKQLSVSSIKNKPNNISAILDYSFVHEEKNPQNKIKIPLFQILYPKQYKEYQEKILKQKKEKNDLIKRPCRLKSTVNIFPINMKLTNIKSSIMNRKSVSNFSTIKNKMTKSEQTTPLYLRINEVNRIHEEEIKKLKEKYYGEKTNEISESISSTSSYYTKINRKKNFEKWYNCEKSWLKMREIKLNLIKKEIDDNKFQAIEEEKKEETFKPQINKNSIKIFEQVYKDDDFLTRLKDYQGKKKENRNQREKNLIPTFKPYINQSYEIKDNYYDYMKFNQRKINQDFLIFLDDEEKNYK